jgi:transposase
MVVSGREGRFKQERADVSRRRMVDASPHALLGLERLTQFCARAHAKRRRGRKASQKQRRANRHASTWVFAELHGYLAYQVLLVGGMAVNVDTYHTSQARPRCGYTSENNRAGKGLLFVCQTCHLMLHTDLVGARNVALRTLLAWQAWVSTGVVSERPAVSSDEAKADRRRRYAEARWS